MTASGQVFRFAVCGAAPSCPPGVVMCNENGVSVSAGAAPCPLRPPRVADFLRRPRALLQRHGPVELPAADVRHRQRLLSSLRHHFRRLGRECWRAAQGAADAFALVDAAVSAARARGARRRHRHPEHGDSSLRHGAGHACARASKRGRCSRIALMMTALAARKRPSPVQLRQHQNAAFVDVSVDLRPTSSLLFPTVSPHNCSVDLLLGAPCKVRPTRSPPRPPARPPLPPFLPDVRACARAGRRRRVELVRGRDRHRLLPGGRVSRGTDDADSRYYHRHVRVSGVQLRRVRAAATGGGPHSPPVGRAASLTSVTSAPCHQNCSYANGGFVSFGFANGARGSPEEKRLCVRAHTCVRPHVRRTYTHRAHAQASRWCRWSAQPPLTALPASRWPCPACGRG
jgi:hypothetical protein